MNNSLAPMQASLPSSISYADPAAVAAAEAAKARIQAAYIMAMQRPRSYDQSRIKILEACSRPSFAEKVEYSKPVGGGKPIVGPSIRFAELALREWGNISYESQVVYDDEITRRGADNLTFAENALRWLDGAGTPLGCPAATIIAFWPGTFLQPSQISQVRRFIDRRGYDERRPG